MKFKNIIIKTFVQQGQFHIKIKIHLGVIISYY